MDHLIEEGVRTESELEKHIGGFEPERDVLYPPKIKPFRLAFAAIADRLGKLGDAEKRLRDATRTPRLSETSRQGPSGRERWLRRAKTAVDAAKKELRTDRAVFEAIGATRGCGSDAVRKALEKSRREGGERWERFVDYRQIITATPQRPGTPRLFLDIEEVERRHPGAWGRLPRRD